MPFATGALLGLVLIAQPAPSKADAVFWQWFEGNARRLAAAQRPSEQLLDEVQRELQKAEPGLAFEIGYEGPRAPRMLVVSADGARERFAAVKRLVGAAPRKVPGWQVVAFRQRKPGLEVAYQGVRLHPRDVWFSSERVGGAVNVLVHVRESGSHPLPAVQGAVLLLLDSTLGEYDVETRVEGIEIRPLPVDPRAAWLRPLSELPAVVDAVKALGPER